MFTLLLRKMRNTKWMVFCLLIGCVMACAMMATIPIYMNASLQRMLVKDLEVFQQDYNIYPGMYNTKYAMNMSLNAEGQRQLIEATEKAVDESFEQLDVEATNKRFVSDDYLYAANFSTEAGGDSVKLHLGAMSGIADNITITQGRMFEPGENGNGAFEVITTERAMKVTGIAVGQTYELANIFDPSKGSIRVEVVGVFEPKEGCEAYWAEGLDEYLSSVLADYDTYLGEMLDTGALHTSQYVNNYAIDYNKLDMTRLDSFIEKIDEQAEAYKQAKVSFSMPAKEIIEDYAERASQLRLVLWLLQIPIMLMILFYLFMVAQLNVEQEKNEIAVFKSRGASRGQVVLMYALESVVIGVCSALLAPFAGLLLCRILGASNGFLEFVNRSSIPARLSFEAFIYSFIAAAVFFATTMLPIFPATKETIVGHKQSKAKKRKLSLWEKTGLDIILLGGSVGWLYYYKKEQAQLLSEGVTDITATVNPMLFVASTGFILGCGLLIIRLYPLMIRLIAFAGRRFWPPSIHVSLNNIGRSSTGREKFLILFLVLTVSLGLFFANTARALNRSATDQINYAVGCDVRLTETWKSNKVSKSSQGQSAASFGMTGNTSGDEEEEEVDASTLSYEEPDFTRFEKLDGVEAAARVFRKDSVTLSSSKMKVPKKATYKDKNERKKEDFMNMEDTGSSNSAKDVTLMTVDPSEFSKVVWTTPRLFPTHINNYLNALADYNSGVILSTSFRDTYGLKLGDTVSCKWGSNSEFTVTVLAFVDCWPSIQPYAKTETGEYRDFAIMNFDYVRVATNVEPYEVWLNLKDGTKTEDFYTALEDAKKKCDTLEVASQQIIQKKNDPMLQGMNGALTLGFIIIMIMCIIGFLIYWIISIRSRTLQFGILRAMGMKFREIIAMLITEQVLVSGAAIVLSFVVGSIASELFVPLFQSFMQSGAYPEFAVIPERGDYLKIYAALGAMLLFCFAVLGRLIRGINISKALKLGED
ncbi:MAG: FtsX-like permease family protein [Ruminococcus sp.]|nr:FtsX-like permease family protein [Ruminococcus sp.]